MIDTGLAVRCNNDHGISPDGTQLVISDQAEERHSLIYTLPITGGTPKRVTKLGPSYWHGWSPDGKTLIYCAERNKEFDVYSISVNGGDETRLTTASGLDDGPNIRPTENTFTSIPTAPVRCRFGACSPTARRRSKSPRTNSTIGSRILRRMESGWCS